MTVRGEPLSLPLKEFELLHVLLANAGRVLPRETLIDRVWGSDYVGDTKTLDVHIKRLRAKIEPDPADPTRIVTIRGLGYKYERSSLRRPTRSGAASADSGSDRRHADRCQWPARAPSRRLRRHVHADSRPMPKFRRLAITHAAMMGGDAAMVVALADSLFFSIDPSAARSKVLLFLLVSFAPFVVVAPLIGPAIDRMAGGRRLVIQIVAVARVVLSLLMAGSSTTLPLFPLVFAALVLQKT